MSDRLPPLSDEMKNCKPRRRLRTLAYLQPFVTGSRLVSIGGREHTLYRIQRPNGLLEHWLDNGEMVLPGFATLWEEGIRYAYSAADHS